jgi:hypothetical protein
MGGVTAAMCIAQYGMPAKIDDEKRRWANKLVAVMKPLVEKQNDIK